MRPMSESRLDCELQSSPLSGFQVLDQEVSHIVRYRHLFDLTHGFGYRIFDTADLRISILPYGIGSTWISVSWLPDASGIDKQLFAYSHDIRSVGMSHN